MAILLPCSHNNITTQQWAHNWPAHTRNETTIWCYMVITPDHISDIWYWSRFCSTPLPNRIHLLLTRDETRLCETERYEPVLWDIDLEYYGISWGYMVTFQCASTILDWQVNSLDSKICIAGCEICQKCGRLAKCPKNCFLWPKSAGSRVIKIWSSQSLLSQGAIALWAAIGYDSLQGAPCAQIWACWEWLGAP